MNAEDKLSDDVVYPDLTKLVNISEEEYEKRYGSPLFGFIIGGRNILRRNASIALGNTRNTQALAPLKIAGQDEDIVVASHARWAILKQKRN